MRTVLAIAALVAVGAAQSDRAALSFVRAIDLPGVEGRIDHLAYDPSTHRLFVAALGNGSLEVLDAAAGVHLRSLPGFHEPQGVAVVPDAKSVVVAEGQGDGAEIVDAVDLRRRRGVTLGDDSDNVRYDAAAKAVYVGYGDGALAALSATDGRVTGRVTVGGHPESFQLETAGPRIYVNVPSARRIVVVDRAAMKVVAAWPVTAASANYPMALDEGGHRLFVGCRNPATLLVYDTRTAKEAASTDIAGDADDLFYDAARHRVYVIGGAGFIDVLDAAAAAPIRIARIPTAAGARTGLFLAGEGRLYLAVPHRGAQRAEVRIYAAPSS